MSLPSKAEWPTRAEVDDILAKLSDPSVIDLPTSTLVRAHHAYLIYGDPELHPDAVVRWSYGSEDRRRAQRSTRTTIPTTTSTTTTPEPDYSTGLGKR